MCLYPKIIRNPKYQKNKKNGGEIPPVYDERVLHLPIGCQNCIECRKQKARSWKVRLLEDIKENKNGKFITLTFSNQAIKHFHDEIKKDCPEIEGYAMDNAIATTAVRLFLERWRKEYKISLRHWLITELGHNGTENIHLHGIVWTDYKATTKKQKSATILDVERIWNSGEDKQKNKLPYGFVWKGKMERYKLVNYVNEATATYITKYVHKADFKHKSYKPIVLTSPGIGANYTKQIKGDWEKNKYNEETNQTNETYRTRSGHKIALPIYWRNKIYSDQEREKLWIEKLDKQERWICGERVDIQQGMDNYFALLEWYRRKNTQLGYGGDINWKRDKYEQERRKLIIAHRIQNAA